jgi:hypothetical protein
MLKHSLRGLIVGVGDCLPDCPEHRIVFGLQAGVGLFDRQLDILTDQPSASSKEDGPIGLGRLDHRLMTFFGANFGEVTKEASRERLASTNGATVQITRLAGFPLGRSADFSYV